MNILNAVASSDRLFPLAFLQSLPIDLPAAAAPPSAPRPRVHEAGDGLGSLLAGLETNYQVDGASEQELGEKVEEVSESAEAVTESVATPSNQAATISKAISEGKAAEKVSDVAGKLGDGVGVVAKPLSIANNVNTLVSDEDGEDKASAATGLASDLSFGARTLGAAADGGAGLSNLSALASAQSKVAAVAPGAAGAAAKVGQAAPVVGGVAGVVTGGLDIKDAVQGDDKTKFATGGLKVASGVAMMVPGGMPIAMGLGAAALAIEHRETIGKGAKAVGKGAVKGAKAVGSAAKKGVEAVGDTAKKGTETAGKVASGVGKALGFG